MAMLFAAGAVSAAEPLNAPDKRYTDEAIRSDHLGIAAVQKRIHALNDAGRPIADYHLSKAQCWLDTAFHEYSRNDRTGYPQAALDESRSLVAAMEAGSTPPSTTALVAGARRLREDLWARAETLKKHPGFRCAQQQVACLEVELVHAGHEYAQYGWRHARTYIQLAEDDAEQAGAAAAACQPLPQSAPAPAAPPAAAGPAERLSLRADSLFAFDRASLADVSVQGRQRLGEFASRLLNGYERVDTVLIYGHTDRLGRADHNQKLSQARADTVRDYLEMLGVKAPMVAVGRGSTQPISSCGATGSNVRTVMGVAPGAGIPAAPDRHDGALGAAVPVIAPTAGNTPTDNERASATAGAANAAAVSAGSKPAGVTGKDGSTDSMQEAARPSAAKGAGPASAEEANAPPDLTLIKTHAGALYRGQAGAIFVLTVSNIGAGASSGSLTVTDALPRGLTPISGVGAGWNCSISGQLFSCTSAEAIAPHSAAPSITLFADVAANAAASLTNTANVSGGGEPVANMGNNGAADPTAVLPTAPPPGKSQAATSLDAGSSVQTAAMSATDRQRLIDCLAPDRRVEIEVYGVLKR
jgi:outer membrane protein OmpA-like peptidoglycan-associated protein